MHTAPAIPGARFVSGCFRQVLDVLGENNTPMTDQELKDLVATLAEKKRSNRAPSDSRSDPYTADSAPRMRTGAR